MSCKKFRRTIKHKDILELYNTPLFESAFVVDKMPFEQSCEFQNVIFRVNIERQLPCNEKDIAYHLIRLIEAGYVEVV